MQICGAPVTHPTTKTHAILSNFHYIFRILTRLFGKQSNRFWSKMQKFTNESCQLESRNYIVWQFLHKFTKCVTLKSIFDYDIKSVTVWIFIFHKNNNLLYILT